MGTDTWVNGIRTYMKQHKGFAVINDRGRVRLQYRRTGMKSQTIALDFEWGVGDWSQLANRIGNVVPLVQAGADLTTATRGAALASSQHSEDWQSALEAYRDGPQARLKDITWNGHLKVINLALAALQKRNAPTNGADLVDVALKGWTPGTRQYSNMRQRIHKFLTTASAPAVPKTWLPQKVVLPSAPSALATR